MQPRIQFDPEDPSTRRTSPRGPRREDRADDPADHARTSTRCCPRCTRTRGSVRCSCAGWCWTRSGWSSRASTPPTASRPRGCTDRTRPGGAGAGALAPHAGAVRRRCSARARSRCCRRASSGWRWLLAVGEKDQAIARQLEHVRPGPSSARCAPCSRPRRAQPHRGGAGDERPVGEQPVGSGPLTNRGQWPLARLGRQHGGTHDAGGVAQRRRARSGCRCPAAAGTCRRSC